MGGATPHPPKAAVDRLEDKLAGYHAYHATRAEAPAGLQAYDKALELAGNIAENAYRHAAAISWARPEALPA